MHPFFSIEDFESHAPHWKLVYFTETDSTNEQAKQHILSSSQTQKDALSGTVFLTDKQTQGKGRRNNQWTSSPGEDLLFTVVIETELPLAEIHKLATTTALALSLSLEKMGLNPMIKFPNDIYINDKKTAGILIEQIEAFTLIGVGINVNSQPTIETATSLSQQQISHSTISRESLLALFLGKLAAKLSLCNDHYLSIQKSLQKYDLFYQKRIQFTQDSENYTGIAKGVSKNGYLLVLLDNDDSTEYIEVHNGHTFRLI